MFDTDLLASLCIAENRSCWRKKAARLSSFIRRPVTRLSCLVGQRVKMFRIFRVKMLSKFWGVGLVFRAFGMEFDGGQDRAIRFA